MIEEKSRLRRGLEFGGKAVAAAGVGLIIAYFVLEAASKEQSSRYVDPRYCFAETEQEELRRFKQHGNYCLEDLSRK
jgi:uncharacterized membrane protein